MPPSPIRPSAAEEPPRRAKTPPKAAPKTPPKPAPRTTARSGMTDAELRAALIDGYNTLGTLAAGAGYLRRNPGLALAGFNMLATAEDQADGDIKACKQNPRLRALLVRGLESSVMATWVSAKVAIAAPVIAALVPHPFASAIANKSIDPRAHLMALETMPDLFMAPQSEPTTSDNSTDGQV